MSKIMCHLLSLAVVALSLTKVFAFTDEDKAVVNEFLAPILAECSSEHGVTEEEIKQAKESYKADAVKPCFLGCVLKKAEFLDNKGMYTPDKGLNIVKSLVKNTDGTANLEEIGNKCLKVNDATVSDGEEGCERAKLVLNCAIENKVELPF